ncbi:MAG: DUF4956 domain-containing protein [Clostridia bacterium]|nr:DUF4956 domain-containing protein [Clostridia bacterium]
MLDSLFTGLFETTASSTINAGSFLLCVAASVVIGVMLSLVFTYKSSHSKSFLITLALLPSIVCVVIMMVNGNIGAGVAVAGAFSLVRFRSIPGSAKEICAIFLAMAAGLANGMGYIAYGFLFVIIMCIMNYIFNKTGFGNKTTDNCEKTVRITIPEDLDYSGVFDDLFDEYTTQNRLLSVKTSNMGSLYKLTYDITLRDAKLEKELIDKLRCRNGNLEISSSVQQTNKGEL